MPRGALILEHALIVEDSTIGKFDLIVEAGPGCGLTGWVGQRAAVQGEERIGHG